VEIRDERGIDWNECTGCVVELRVSGTVANGN